MGTGILVVGEGADQKFLAEHLEAAGYGVATVSPAEAVSVLRFLRPFAILVAPGLPDWQKNYLRETVKTQYPDIELVVVRRRSAASKCNS